MNDIISHYRAEGKALPDYSKHPGGSFRGVAILLPPRERWQAEGVDLVLFDPPAEYLRASPEGRKAILGNGTSDDGALITSGVPVQQGEGKSLGVRLRTLAESNDRWTEMKDQYDVAVLQGRTKR
ncbi:hypothetical protein VM1G_01441 [Cytospora mali]|uniref:Uncharacterized protein n=1 Tax=Cytospora mali TaxID=578113 RepID=A0A194VNM5_CYTMA|nr:hypothetical protein VM1G_01441 [Valsa mali]